MRLSFNEMKKAQPDPFVLEEQGTFYLYSIADSIVNDGVTVYTSDRLDGEWCYRGIVTAFGEGRHTLWAPSVTKIGEKFYMYVSCLSEAGRQFMHVAEADSPLGPFKNEKCLYDHFSIDSHMVETEAGLFLWYAKDNLEGERIGTRVYVDRFLDPYTPENDPKEVLVPEFEEERYTTKKVWYTLEGPFWFQEGEWQYLMYSAGCYRNDSYHVGYAVAKTTEQDLKKVNFVKVTNGEGIAPVLIKNEFEEGTGHNSVIKHKGTYYAFYHGRDYGDLSEGEFVDTRTARICRLEVADGRITAKRYRNKI